MAYGLSRDHFNISEGTLEIGTWTNPHLIASTANPLTSFSSAGIVSYFQQGTLVAGLNDTFAEFLAGTPGKRIRKDLTMRDFTLSVSLAQFNKDVLALALNADVDGTGSYPLAFIGNDAPVKPQNGYLLRSKRVDEKELYIAVWAGEITTEDKSLTFSGTAHTIIPATIQAFEHTSFIANPNDKRNYGAIWLDLT